ncbi:hypothetical protein B0T16DRAFT_160022 [Cercophora newfieldiana]|uniref:Uncharacterized protein n=1 Tax=Cercophora newfieldiana TaxID=92897 RepID=A0AA39Y5F2_9PEZI|nr:hypothetical protein B0T16DRAFT_160022 [Cercophora newfieldiana]
MRTLVFLPALRTTMRCSTAALLGASRLSAVLLRRGRMQAIYEELKVLNSDPPSPAYQLGGLGYGTEGWSLERYLEDAKSSAPSGRPYPKQYRFDNDESCLAVVSESVVQDALAVDKYVGSIVRHRFRARFFLFHDRLPEIHVWHDLDDFDPRYIVLHNILRHHTHEHVWRLPATGVWPVKWATGQPCDWRKFCLTTTRHIGPSEVESLGPALCNGPYQGENRDIGIYLDFDRSKLLARATQRVDATRAALSPTDDRMHTY